MQRPGIPITVFTGYLGSGKTTTILALLPQLPPGYRVVLLKNEFGDVEVDSRLGKQSSLQAVSEILNGCMCCILVGQMKTALLEIRDKYAPDRIIIETSGSAFPATLAFQIRELERETSGGLKLDAIVTMIDAQNFMGYEDTSPTAKMQATYTDMILINKWEDVSARELDIVMDHIHTLNDETPKVRCNGRNGVSPSLIFNLDTKLFSSPIEFSEDHHREVETATIWRDCEPPEHIHVQSCTQDHVQHDQQADIGPVVTQELLFAALSKIPKDCIYRVKGFVRFEGSERTWILNWAFGRFNMTEIDGCEQGLVKLNIIGVKGEVRKWAKGLSEALGANVRN